LYEFLIYLVHAVSPSHIPYSDSLLANRRTNIRQPLLLSGT
jgi:hypothetical protein